MLNYLLNNVFYFEVVYHAGFRHGSSSEASTWLCYTGSTGNFCDDVIGDIIEGIGRHHGRGG